MTALPPEAVEVQAPPDLSDLARYTGLTTVEIAAAKTDLHMSTCPQHVWDCVDCTKKTKEIRAIIAAVSPVIEELIADQHEREVLKEIAERDRNAGWADRLADAIAAVTGVEIGEHSNLNDPWANALMALGLPNDAPAPRHAAPDDGIGDDGEVANTGSAACFGDLL